MVTLINIPHELQNLISNFLRPHKRSDENVDQLSVGINPYPVEIKMDPFSKAPGVSNFKEAHSNLNNIPLWKNHEWKKRIREWRDEHLTKMRWVYKYGTLPEKMIQKCWESKINNNYRHQDCYVQTMIRTSIGTGFSEVEQEYKVILFEVSLQNLITGIRPLPHCFGSNQTECDLSGLQIDANFVPAPSLKTMIPKDNRREWLLECFTKCILDHWGIIVKNIGNK